MVIFGKRLCFPNGHDHRRMMSFRKFSGLRAYLHHQEIAAIAYLPLSKMKHFPINNYNKFEPITCSFFGKRSQMVVMPFFDVTVASPP